MSQTPPYCDMTRGRGIYATKKMTGHGIRANRHSFGHSHSSKQKTVFNKSGFYESKTATPTEHYDFTTVYPPNSFQLFVFQQVL